MELHEPEYGEESRVRDEGGMKSEQMQQPRLARSKTAAQQALRRLRFITEATSSSNNEELWKTVESRFHGLSSAQGLLSRDDFAQCIGMKESREFGRVLFDALARNTGEKGERSIKKEELYQYFLELTDESFDNRLHLFFAMFDRNADGRITEEEVKEVIMLSASANKLSKLKEQADEYAALIMEELDLDNLGYIEVGHLESLLLQEGGGIGGYMSNLSQSLNLSQMFVPKTTRDELVRCTHRMRFALQKNWKRIWIVCVWVGAMAGLFAWKVVQYRALPVFQVMGYCVCVAKGAAETLKLNMALILLPVCRNTITWLRSTKPGYALIPFDDNINFHKLISMGILIAVIVHGGVHLACDFPRIASCEGDKFMLIHQDFPDMMRPPTYAELMLRNTETITGLIMVFLMLIAFTLATSWFRRSLLNLPKPLHRITGFNAFWYSHHLFFLVYALLIIHGVFLIFTHSWYQKTTWMYLVMPISLYMGERILRAFRSSYHGVSILKVAIYPGNVLTLHMSKPAGFKYKSGQYIFLKCPEISPFEWHPFSMTSAPAGDSYISVHIRVLGDWTAHLRRIFSEVCELPIGDESGLLRSHMDEGGGRVCSLPRILIDGPYGAPAQYYKQYEIVLLIGLGIGATPFISILKDIMYHIKHHPHPSSNEETRRNRCATKGRHSYFYWITREQGSFDWFKGVMNEIPNCDHKGVIELHNYLTSVYEEGDARSALITMLQALNYAKRGLDILSGTRVRTHLGRPNWRKVFSKIASIHKGSKIGVFYCGVPILAKDLKKLVNEYNEKYSPIYGTQFRFHKENF